MSFQSAYSSRRSVLPPVVLLSAGEGIHIICDAIIVLYPYVGAVRYSASDVGKSVSCEYGVMKETP